MAITLNAATGYPLFAPRALLYVINPGSTTLPNIGSTTDLVETTSIETYLASATADNLTTVCKSVTITPGTFDVGIINTMGSSTDREVEGGSTSDNTLSIDNAIIDQKRQDLCTVKFTLIASVGSLAAVTNNIVYLLTGGTNILDQIAATNVYTGRGGWKTTANRARYPHPVVFYITDGTYEKWVMLNYAWCTDMEESLDAEGHQEVTLTLKCLPRNFHYQVAVS